MNSCRDAFAGLVLAAVLAAAPAAVRAADVDWQGWSFDFDVAGDFTGLNLSNVTFQGRLLIAKVNFPVMRVFYTNNACGPFADRLGGTLAPIPWANDATIAQREFTLNGQQWYEIGIRDLIGAYDMYQVFYLSANGILDAHIYAKGLQCVVNHLHYPNWRIDFALDGEADDQILRDPGTGFVVQPTEFDALATTAADHAWRVRDTLTGLYVDVLPGFADFSIPDGSTPVPVTDYSNHTAFGRRYRASEDGGWTYGATTQVPFGNGEDIDGEDIVLWYEGYLPHTAAEGGELWHSTGIRLVSSLTLPPDNDGDGVADAADNCTQVANPGQLDADADGYGNSCDADLNNSGMTTAVDFNLLRSVLNQPATASALAAAADMDGSGMVTAADFNLLRARINTAPGPSGTVP